MKVAIIAEALWSMGGANHVVESFCDMYPDADVFALFGDTKKVSEKIRNHAVNFSFLNKFPFIKKIYRYTYFLWPLAIESFDLSNYDLVISSSYSVAHGVVTPLGTKHLAYVHTPMRYAWDLKDVYFNKKNFSWWKRLLIPIFLVYLRAWDVASSARPDVVIANSAFVKKRIEKYWGRKVDDVINPPVKLFKGKIVKQRQKYFVVGAPFEPNKMGEFLCDRAVELGFDLKVIGTGGSYKEMLKKYSKYSNIEFLGYISDKEKYEVMSKAQGYIMPGIEEFGIFAVEAMSCGTPVLGSHRGGIYDYLVEGSNGMLFEFGNKDSFKEVLGKFEKKKWVYVSISKGVKRFGEVGFKDSFERIVK
jgi:glycosyltransferase involved in cell wall biosynthesis